MVNQYRNPKNQVGYALSLIIVKIQNILVLLVILIIQKNQYCTSTCSKLQQYAYQLAHIFIQTKQGKNLLNYGICMYLWLCKLIRQRGFFIT